MTGKLLSALQKFGSNLSDYMHLFLPPIVRLFDSPEVPMQVHFRVVDLLIRCGRCKKFPSIPLFFLKSCTLSLIGLKLHS